MGMESVWLRQLTYALRPYYHNASDCEKIIIEHACIAGAGALIPLPVASVIVIVGSTYSMFIRIFTKLGIKLKKNIGRTIVSYITTCLIGNLGAALLAFLLPLAADLLKWIPGIGTLLAFLIGPVGNAVVVYVYGCIFLNAITILCKTGKEVSEENLKESISTTARDSSDDIKNSVKEARDMFKKTNFNEYKSQAENLYEENKNKCVNCGTEIEEGIDVCPNCHKNPRKIE
ncbi:MAG: hypothetical protein K5751_00895 [Treponemataceae bacterium]|nr:hypothetical protein [Treponemataceae bacterium]